MHSKVHTHTHTHGRSGVARSRAGTGALLAGVLLMAVASAAHAQTADHRGWCWSVEDGRGGRVVVGGSCTMLEHCIVVKMGIELGGWMVGAVACCEFLNMQEVLNTKD